jgi:hypothetical protein
MTSTLSIETISPDERYAGEIRELRLQLRPQIKEAAVAIRQLKRERRQLQKEGEWLQESQLQKLRRQTRARLLILGFLGGKHWGEIETNYLEGDDRIRPEVKRVFDQLWASQDQSKFSAQEVQS